MSRILIIILSSLWSASSWSLDLSGTLQPGGLVTAKLAPGSKAFLNQKSLWVAEDGLLVVGFGRDADLDQILKVKSINGGLRSYQIRLKPRSYEVQRIEGLPPKKVNPPLEQIKRISKENALLKTARALRSHRTDFLDGFIWPLNGRITGVYGSQRVLNNQPRRPHLGVDIAAEVGTPVLAAGNGIVSLVNSGMFFTGKTVMIEHGHSISSIYVHLSQISVQKGEKVKKGQKIGAVGMTGRATGPHLHWGMSWGSIRLDPQLLVGPMSKP